MDSVMTSNWGSAPHDPISSGHAVAWYDTIPFTKLAPFFVG